MEEMDERHQEIIELLGQINARFIETNQMKLYEGMAIVDQKMARKILGNIAQNVLQKLPIKSIKLHPDGSKNYYRVKDIEDYMNSL